MKFFDFDPHFLKKYAQNTLILFLEKSVRLFDLIFIWMFVIRYLGPEKYGLLAYAVSYVEIFRSFVQLGLKNILIQELILRPKQIQIILASGWWLRVIVCLICVPLLSIGHFLFNQEISANVFIIIYALIFVFQSFEILIWYFESRVENQYFLISSIIQVITTGALKLFLVFNQAPTIAFVLTLVVEQAIIHFLMLRYYRQKNYPSFFSYTLFDRQQVKIFLKRSLYICLGAVIGQMFFKIDVIMIKNMLSDAQAGIYSTAVSFINVFYFIPILICDAIFPALVQHRENNALLFRKRLLQLNILLVLVSGLMILVTYYFAGDIIHLLLGKEFYSSISILMTLMWVHLTVALKSVWIKEMAVSHKERFILLFSFIFLIMNVMLNYIFIQNWKIYGAAYSTVLIHLIAAIFLIANAFFGKYKEKM